MRYVAPMGDPIFFIEIFIRNSADEEVTLRASTEHFTDEISGTWYSWREALLDPGKLVKNYTKPGTIGRTQANYGSISIDNRDRFYDQFLSHAWAGSKYQVFTKYRGQKRSQAVLLYEGIVAYTEPISLTNTTLSIKSYDMGGRLKDRVPKKLFLGTDEGNPSGVNGGGDLKDVPMPVCLGFARGAPLILVNPAILLYYRNDYRDCGPLLRLRDGEYLLEEYEDPALDLATITDPDYVIPPGHFVSLDSLGLVRLASVVQLSEAPIADMWGGKFRFTLTSPDPDNEGSKEPSPGIPTGDLVLADRTLDIVKALLYYYGEKPILWDEAAFAAAEVGPGANSPIAGAYITNNGQMTREKLLNELLSPVHYIHGLDPFTGQYTINRLLPPTGTYERHITENDIAGPNKIKLLSIQEPVRVIEILYGYDYTEAAFSKTVKKEAVGVFKRTRYESIEPGATVAYRQITPFQIETRIENEFDAADLAVSWSGLLGVTRFIIEVVLQEFSTESHLGKEFRVSYPLFGLDDGREMIIIGEEILTGSKEHKLILWG